MSLGGIVFFRTLKLEECAQFYLEDVGCTLWLDQGGCKIFRFHNMLFGLCDRTAADTNGMITFVCDTNEEVDAAYKRLKDQAQSEPKDNEEYRIYHFFTQDPEGRPVEFQRFWDSFGAPLESSMP